MVDYAEALASYKDDEIAYDTLHKKCIEKVSENKYLSLHRDWVEQNSWGYGDRELHWMWKLIVDQMPKDFKFLEIGVFKGQTISLVSLIAQIQMKNCEVVGITPLTNSGDQYSNHPDIDYFTAIRTIFDNFRIKEWDKTKIIRGYSNDETVINMSSAAGPYDIVYIDGCHDYDVVCSDINNYKHQVKAGGLLVIDDCNNYLKIPQNKWSGFPDVSNAVRDCLENDTDFELQFAVTHNRIWRKIDG
jgi:hypothetical protein